MTFANPNYQQPRVIKITKPVNEMNLIVHGQGIIVFDASCTCCINLFDSDATSGLRVRFTDSNVLVNMLPSNEPLIDKDNAKGIITQDGAYYWFSIDSQNQRLVAGIGEARRENAIYTFQFAAVDKKRNKLFMESLVSVHVENLTITCLLRDPITGHIPLLIKNTESLLMESIATGNYMPKANLSLVSQKLHDCISGKRFTLNTPDFPHFTRAIEYSIATPGKWCYECLKQKATEFDKDKPDEKETYLRITLGENNGESPGIPYVMEIWPVGHYSPVHNHGGSSAIIRVLHGSINVSLFPFLSSSNDVAPFAKADFKKGDITWISPSLNQVHQLRNLETNKDTCITIQCYMYETSDTVHYDYFDYLDSNNNKDTFDPDSDAEFIEFKDIIKKEWAEHKKSFCCNLFHCFQKI